MQKTGEASYFYISFSYNILLFWSNKIIFKFFKSDSESNKISFEILFSPVLREFPNFP